MAVFFRRKAQALQAALMVVFATWGAVAAENPAQITVLPHEVSVQSGDSFEFGGRRIHLAGIAAPELEQNCIHNDNDWPCGEIAKQKLSKLLQLQSGNLLCYKESVPTKPNTYACFLGTHDISEILLKSGMVVALPKAPHHYVAAEQEAKEAKMGVWASEFTMPWVWKKPQP